MKRLFLIVGGVIAAGVVILGGLYLAYPQKVLSYVPAQLTAIGGLGRSFLFSLAAPAGVLKTEINPAFRAAAAAPPPGLPAASPVSDDWPSYNKTLTSNRFSPLSQINTKNIASLKVVCTYDTGVIGSFESGLIMVNGALIGTTEFDIFSVNPATCAQNWRTHESGAPYVMSVNRGAAYMDGMLYRGDENGRVLAYDFKTGKRVWATTIADRSRGETAPSSPIVWNGLVFIGNAGGDNKGAKGHMFALDAKTGQIIWESFLVPRTADDRVRGPLASSPFDRTAWKNPPAVPISGGGTWTSYTLDPSTGLLYVPVGNAAPDFVIRDRLGQDPMTDSVAVLDAKTGAYRKHYPFLQLDWHDWDASNPPALIHTQGGKYVMVAAPKDGNVYGYDLADDHLLYRVPATTILNADEPFSTKKDVHFCPGVSGGDEWNTPGYYPALNLVYVGEVDWCTTVRLQTDKEMSDVPLGQPWTGEKTYNPFNAFGEQTRGDRNWGGWVHAIDADTGVWKWRIRTNYPILGGITPTAGGLLFFGDAGGNFYAVDAATGARLWGQKIGGAIGGGVITYTVGGAQKVAVAAGFINPIWPVQVTTGKIVVLGLR